MLTARIRRVALLGATLLALSTISGVPVARAGDPVVCPPDEPFCDVSVDGSPGAPATPGTPGSGTPGHSTCHPPSGPGIPADVDCNGCTWERSDVVTPQEHFENYVQYKVVCYGAGHRPPRFVWVPPTWVVPTAGKPAGDWALDARAKLRLPVVRLATNPTGLSYVQLQTFLWVQPASWTTRSARAGNGIREVTATATPVKVVWNMGEDTMVCRGPGTVWNPRGADDQTTNCGYTYKRSSIDQPGEGNDKAYPIRAKVVYRISWTCSGSCDVDAGTLPDMSMTAASKLRVFQLQTVITRKGSS